MDKIESVFKNLVRRASQPLFTLLSDLCKKKSILAVKYCTFTKIRYVKRRKTCIKRGTKHNITQNN